METYKYLGILKADRIQHAEMKERNTSEEQENYSKPNKQSSNLITEINVRAIPS